MMNGILFWMVTVWWYGVMVGYGVVMVIWCSGGGGGGGGGGVDGDVDVGRSRWWRVEVPGQVVLPHGPTCLMV